MSDDSTGDHGRSDADGGVSCLWVPAAVAVAGPRVCLASVDDHRVGRLTGQWVSLAEDVEVIVGVARSVLRRAVASPVDGVAIYDIDGSPLDEPDVIQALRPALGLRANSHGR